MKKILLAVAISVLVSSCDRDKNSLKCYHGTVIMSSCCSGSTFIELDLSTPIGKATTLNGKDYKNVIQVPGFLSGTEVYLNLREFIQPDDDSLFAPIRCYCLISEGMDVPIWVQTDYSNTSCAVGTE